MKAGFIPFFLRVLAAQGKSPSGEAATMLANESLLAAFTTYVQAQLPTDAKPGDVLDAIVAEFPTATLMIRKAATVPPIAAT